MTKDRWGDRPALEWRESKVHKWQDELRVGQEMVAALLWQGSLSTQARATSPTGQWTFERPRVFSRDVEVRDAGSGALVALLRAGWTGDGMLETVDGRAFYWTYNNFFRTKWSFSTAGGEQLVRFYDDSRLFEKRALVEVASRTLPQSDRNLLLLLGWYLMTLADRDSASAAAAAAASSVAVT
jgi:hypothetical protein